MGTVSEFATQQAENRQNEEVVGIIRDRLTAGRETLNLSIMVRIHVSEPSRPVPTDRDRG